MRLAIRFALTALFAARAICAQQVAADSGDEFKGTVAGTVVNAKTGEVLKSVAIDIQPVFDPANRARPAAGASTRAGADGRFSFSKLAPGEYSIFATKAGYSARRPFQPALSIRLGRNESREDVVVRLAPSAIVTGHVFDAYGDPLINATVCAINRVSGPTQRSVWVARQRAQTNDLGEYRLSDLATGKYLLAVQAPQTGTPVGVAEVEFATSFYPGASTMKEATPVKLGPGVELSGIDFRLSHSPATVVRGVIVDANGQPCNDCGIRVAEDEVMNLDVSGYPTPDGVFVLQGFRPGVRSVAIHSSGGPIPNFSRHEIVIPESGDHEVHLVVNQGHPVAGRLVFDDPPEEKSAQAASNEPAAPEDSEAAMRRAPPFTILLELLNSYYFSPGARAVVPPDRSEFEMPSVPPGEFKIRIVGGIPGVYLRSVTLDGRDLQEPRLTVTPEGPLSGLELHLAFDGGTIAGTVKRDGDEPFVTGDPTVIAVPEDKSNPFATSVTGRIDASGAFTIRGLAPGSYKVFASPSLFLDHDDPEIRKALEPYTKTVTLKKEETKNVDLQAAPEGIELW